MKILACADIHLDNSTYGRSDQSGLTFRTEDHMTAFSDIVDKAINEIKPNLFCIQGDIFESPYPPNNVREFFNEQVSKLKNAKINVRIIPGNHDTHKFHCSVQPLRSLGLKRVKIYTEPSVERLRNGTVLLYFPHCMTVERKELQLREAFLDFCGSWRPQAEELGWNGTDPVILLGHFPVFGAMMNDGAENTWGDSVTSADLDLCGCDYAMLGDFHAYQVLPTKKCKAVYSGSLERRNFGDIDSEKGFVLYDTEYEGEVGHIQFIPFKGRGFYLIKGGEDQILAGCKIVPKDSPIVKISFSGTVEEYRDFELKKNSIKKQLVESGAVHVIFSEEVCNPDEEEKIKSIREQIKKSGKMVNSDILDVAEVALETEVSEESEREVMLALIQKTVEDVNKDQHEDPEEEAPCHLRIHGVKLHNFMRYGDTRNIVSFDKGADQILDFPQKRIQWQTDQAYKLATEMYPEWTRDTESRILSIVGMTDGDEEVSNGAGKSTILEAISYGLFERVVREYADRYDLKGVSTTSIISENTAAIKGDSYVEMLFSSDEAMWLLRRGRKGNKTHSPIFHLECLYDAKAVSTGSHSERLKKSNKETLHKLIRWDYDTFCNSVMFGQADGGTLLKGSDKARKNVIVDILCLKVLDKYLQAFRDLKKITKSESEANEAKMLALGGQVVNITDLQEQINKSRTEESTYSKSLEVSRKRLDELISSKEDQERQSVIKRLEELNVKSAGLLAEETAQKQTAQDRVNQAQGLVASAEREQRRLTTELEATSASILKSTESIELYDEKAGEESVSLISAAKQAKPQRDEELKKLQESLLTATGAYGKFQGDKQKTETERLSLEVLKGSCGDSDQKVKCSCCGSMVGVSHLDMEIKKCDAEISTATSNLDSVNLEIVELRKQIANVQERLSNIAKFISNEAVILGKKQKWEETKISKLNLESLLEQQKVVLAEKSVQVEELIVARRTEEESIEQITKSFAEQRQETDQEILDSDASLLKLNQVLAGVDQEKITLSDLVTQTTASREAALSEISRNETLIEQSGKIQQEISDLEEESSIKAILIKRLKIIEKIFGMNGVPSLIIERYMPLLNSYVAEYLEIISRGQMRAKMVRRDNGELEIEVAGASSSKPFMLSGGEFVKLKLSFSIALGMLAFVRSSHVPDFICLDEVFSELDKGSKEQVFTAMEKLREKFRDIIVISHDSTLLDRISSTILVNKVDGICRIEKQLQEV